MLDKDPDFKIKLTNNKSKKKGPEFNKVDVDDLRNIFKILRDPLDGGNDGRLRCLGGTREGSGH